MKNILIKRIFIKICIILTLTTVLNIQYVNAHGVIYNTAFTDKNKIKITLKFSDPKEKRGISIVYYHLKKSKTLTIGYEIKENGPSSAYIDYDLSSSLPPIRIILQKIGDEERLFKDVLEDQTTYQYIKHLHDAGIVNGLPDGNFKPDEKISRSEFTVMLIKSLGIKVETNLENKFTDINTHWAKDVILTAARYGFMKGFGDDTIRPDNNILLSEVCAIISNAFKFNTKKDGIYLKLKKEQWYSSYVKKIFDLGILDVNDSIYNNFDEEKPLSRADVSMMLSRALCTY